MRYLKQEKSKGLFRSWLILILCTLYSYSWGESSRPTNPDDPYERYNRVAFKFNDGLDHAILKPAATAYKKIVPKPLVKGIHNIFNNLQNITTVFDDVLQGNFYQATSDTWRLGINSTLGIGGFFDVATPMGLERNYEDFGLTLAKWGYKKSNYLVVPFYGPSTVRDLMGWPVDYFAFSVYPYIPNYKVRYGVYGLGVVDSRAQLLQYQDILSEVAVDKYVFMRSAYMQRRAYQINRNEELGDPYFEKNDNTTDISSESKEKNTIAGVNSGVLIKS